MLYRSKLLENMNVTTKQLEVVHAKLCRIVRHKQLWNVEMTDDVFLDKLLNIPGTDHGKWFYFDPLRKILNRDD